MRIILAAAALTVLAACEPEPTNVVVEPAPNTAAGVAAETPRTSVTPIEFGNGGEAANGVAVDTANTAYSDQVGFEANGTTVVADPDNAQ